MKLEEDFMANKENIAHGGFIRIINKRPFIIDKVVNFRQACRRLIN